MVDLPYAPITEMTPFRLGVAIGRYYWRHGAVDDLLQFPDLGGGDLNSEQRRKALNDFVVFHRPLSALSLFWTVVAFEDFYRDFGTDLSSVTGINIHYPSIADLAVAPVVTKRKYDRPDKDAFTYLDVQKINHNYRKVLGIEAVDPQFEDQIADLALLRHTVAHHAAVI